MWYVLGKIEHYDKYLGRSFYCQCSIEWHGSELQRCRRVWLSNECESFDYSPIALTIVINSIFRL